ncbi:Putative thymidylate synthase [Candidatus Tiddalikarchaeum anstoanum]|nr:Putative thymidylate synthase [Candidatus Tiddalikarchaeum anstoanum]
MSLIELVKNEIGSNGEKGWPVTVRDRIAFPHHKELRVTKANFAVTFLWTMRDAILPFLDKDNLALASNFYTPAGLNGMIRNILANPYIRYVILLGEEYASKTGCETKTELTSANAVRAFFEKGINNERRVAGFETAVHFDNNIPIEMINKVREKVELIDLNKKMPNSSLDNKIKEANKLMKKLTKEPFSDKPFIFGYEKQEETFPYEGGPIIIHGNNIPDSWIKMIHAINRYGRKNLMNANTDRWVKEINDMTVVVHNPQDMDLSINPFLVPLTIEKINAYKSEILSPILPEGKAYTYGNKLRAYTSPSEPIKELVNTDKYKDYEFGKGPWIDANVKYLSNGYAEVDQIKDIIDVLTKDIYSKACVAITWHVQDELMRKHKSSPCLVLLQAMVQDEKLNLTVFFRSHDMTQGWPENAYGCAAIQKEIADRIKVEPGLLTIISGSAQIYAHYYEQVKEMLKKYHYYNEDFKDPRGNYIISVENKKIIVKHLNPKDNSELDKVEGDSAKEVYTILAEKNSLIDPSHLMYIGSELGKAELCIKKGITYEQDRI